MSDIEARSRFQSVAIACLLPAVLCTTLLFRVRQCRTQTQAKMTLITHKERRRRPPLRILSIGICLIVSLLSFSYQNRSFPSLLVSSDLASTETHLSLAVLVHPGNPDAHIWIQNMRQGFIDKALPEDGRQIVHFAVIYDGKKQGEALDRLLENLQQLRHRKIIDNIIQLQKDDSAATTLGMAEPNPGDVAMYAIHQFVLQDYCPTIYCAFLTDDVLAYQGGGMMHAVRMLHAQGNQTVMVMPPLAMNVVANLSKDDLAFDFKSADGTFPFNHKLGRMNVTARPAPGCHSDTRARLGYPSTRHVILHKERLRRMLPLPPKKARFWEEHPVLPQIALDGLCPTHDDDGRLEFVIHPPPWHMGKRLLETCGNGSTAIYALQQAVEHSQGLVVSQFNNMVEESWAEACQKVQVD